MVEENYQEKARTFLQKHSAAILSTVSPEGKPDAAVIYVIADEQMNFFFLTKSNTSKSKNLEHNNNVALTFVDSEKLTTVQVKGIAHLENLTAQYIDEFMKIAEVSNKNWPSPLSTLKDAGSNMLYKIETTWLRYADFFEAKSDQQPGKSLFHQIIPQQ